MAAVCEVCGKDPSLGHVRVALPPAHQASLESEHPEGPRPRQAARRSGCHVCTGCIKSGKVVKAG